MSNGKTPKITARRSADGCITAIDVEGVAIDIAAGVRVASTSLDGGATSIDVVILAIPVADIDFQDEA